MLELASNAASSAADAFANWRLDVAERVFLPLRELAKAAAYHHSQIVDGLPSELSASAVQACRRTTLEAVLTPLAARLAAVNPDTDPDDGGAALTRSLTKIAKSAANRVTLTMRLPLYSSREFGRRRIIWQHAARWQHIVAARWRTTFRRPSRPPVRHVPLRQLLMFHAHVRAHQTVTTIRIEWRQHAARLIEQLATAVDTWTRSILSLEHRIEDGSASELPLEALIGDDHSIDLAPGTVRGSPGALADAAMALQAALDEVAACATLPEAGGHGAVEQDVDALRNDFAIAGTVLLRSKERRVSDRNSRVAPDNARTRYDLSCAQIDHCLRTLRLRDALVGLRRMLLSEVAEHVTKPLFHALGEAAKLLGEVHDPVTGKDAAALPAALEAMRSDVLEPVRAALLRPPSVADALEELHAPGQPQWDTLMKLVAMWPEVSELPRQSLTTAQWMPQGATRRRRFGHELVLLLTPWPSSLAASAALLKRSLRRAWQRTEEIPGILEFSLSAALHELETDQNAHSAVLKARKLVREGISRTVLALDHLAASLNDSWQHFVQSAFATALRDWQVMWRVLLTEADLGHYGRLIWARAGRRRRQIETRLRRRAQTVHGSAGRVLRTGRQRAAALIEQGRTAIGAAEIAENSRLRALETVGPGAMRDLRARLPLVYHKLFDFEAVSEPWLLAGRQSDLRVLRNHVAHWNTRRAGGCLVLPMAPGSGGTSLLSALAAGLESPVTRLTLNARPHSFSGLAMTIASAFGLKATTLEALEAELLAGVPQTCLIDNLEHIMLRTYGGVELMHRFLHLMARTDSRVCWIASVSDLAWQYLASVLGHSASLVSAHNVTAINSPILDNIVMTRHKRSGLQLTFAKPDSTPALLSRKLRRAANEEDRQALLRHHFFERLFLQCGSNVMLALASWLQSVTFKGNSAFVTDPAAYHFRFLKSFGLEHRFAMKAFLMHHSLSPDEHTAVLRTTPEQSATVLQALLNFDIIVPYGLALTRLDSVANRVACKFRYRLHPLLVHPIRQLLRQENIVH